MGWQEFRLRVTAYPPITLYTAKNTYLEFDFAGFHPPRDEDVRSAVKQAIAAHLSPPIKNMGIKGHSARG
jgi:hypothetical protein